MQPVLFGKLWRHPGFHSLNRDAFETALGNSSIDIWSREMKNDDVIKRFSQQEYTRRYGLVSELMGEAGLEALVIYGDSYRGTEVRWLCDFPPRHDTYLIWPAKGEPTLLVRHFNHVPDAKIVSNVEDTRWGGESSGVTTAEVLLEKGLTNGKIGLVGRIPYKDFKSFRSKVPNVEFVEKDRDFSWLRVTKSEEELNWLRKAGQINDATLKALAQAAAPGKTEYELIAALESAYVKEGGEHVLHFFSTTSMESPQAFVPAQVQKDRVLKTGDVIINEIGVGWGGYTTQEHRAFAVGREPTPLYQRIYDVAVRVHNEILALLKPGATIKELLDVGDTIHEAGFTINDGLFHGYGMGISPPPGGRTRKTVLSPHREEFEFQENMVLVVQPNIVDEASGAGLQIGSTVAISADGVEVLTKYPLDFRIVGR
jgi:Xaa-Pro dipeptidase